MTLKPGAEILETFKVAGPLLLILLALILPNQLQMRLATGWQLFGSLARQRRLAILVVGLLTFFGCASISLFISKPVPVIPDEFSYLLAADTFVKGRLSNPTHPCWISFETFYINQIPTYVSKYPPAQGLFLALGQLLTGYPIIGVSLSVALMCGAICWMLQAWLPPRWALLGGLIAMFQFGLTSYWSQSFWGGAIPAFGSALLFGGLRRVISRQKTGDALLMGSGLFILAISRPFEGLICSLPALLLLLSWLIKERAKWPKLVTKIVLPLSVMAVLTIGFISFYNYRTTGNPFLMPYQLHEATYNPVPLFIWQQPKSGINYHHKLIRDFYATTLDWYQFYYRNPWAIFMGSIIKFKVFWLFYLSTVLSIPLITIKQVLKSNWMRFALLICVIVFIGFCTETFTQTHYLAPLTCLIILLVMQSLRYLNLWRWGNRRPGRLITWLLPIFFISMIAMRISMGLIPTDIDEWGQYRQQIQMELEKRGKKQLIIVRYGPEHNAGSEWVFNQAEIDSSPIVWARDTDPEQNCKLIKYFSDREIWLLDINQDDLPPTIRVLPKGNLNNCP